MAYARVRVLLSLLLALSLGGCGLGGFGSALNSALLNQPDVESAAAALPAYLVLSDALIADDPDDGDLLQAGALLYGFYTVNLVPEPARQRLLAERARAYGERALCAEDKALCGLTHCSFDALSAALPGFGADDFPALHAAAVGWLVYIQAHSDDWASLADLPKVEALVVRLLQLAPAARRATLHDYLGILKTLRPAALGGDPEEGRRHFEEALALSGGRDLSFKVDYAARYARAVYDRPLHDRLLQEVLQADPRAPGLTLTNTLAQRHARELLASADDYF